jgi:microcystin degradation protein MlrC
VEQLPPNPLSMAGREKVLTVCFNHETNTFSVSPTTMADFEFRGLLVGAEVEKTHRGSSTEHGGFIAAGERLGLELVHAVFARAQPAGPVADEVGDLVWARLSEALDASPDARGVLLALHGALIMETHGDGDGEGWLLQKLRRKVGPGMPIVATLDLHAHVSAAMVESADALIGYKSYPHVDYFARAAEATVLMAGMIRGQYNPTMAISRPGMIPPPPKQFTEAGAARDVIQQLREMEETGHLSVASAEPPPASAVDTPFCPAGAVHSASVLFGFPWADVPDLGTSFLVVTEANQAEAQRLADGLSARMWARRAEFLPVLLTPAEAVTEAIALHRQGTTDTGPIVLPDMSDNPGGGGASDSIAILEEFLTQGVTSDLCIAAITDAEVVAMATAAGVGTVLSAAVVTLGGKTDELHGPSLTLPPQLLVGEGAGWRVRSLDSTGDYTLTGAMMTGTTLSLGASAVLELVLGSGAEVAVAGEGPPLTVIVGSYRQQILDPVILRTLGVEPCDFAYVSLKSAVHFRSNFTELASEIVEVTGPGIHSSRLSDFEFKRVNRPLWPLPPDDYTPPAAKL